MAVGLPGSTVALALLWTGDHSAKLQWTLTAFVSVGWLALALALRERVVRPLQTISNMLAALREGDFSIRARNARMDDALGLALLEVNELSETLRQQRLGALEATALLRTVMMEIDVAVFAFDEHNVLRLVNRGGERLLAQAEERLVGQRSAAIGLAGFLRGDTPRTINHTFPGGAGRWELRRSTFRQRGREHQLLVIADLSRALREEERVAWQRLVRVLGHEINNSLAPIKSIAGSLQGMLARRPTANGDDEIDEDMKQGLSVIAGRSESLSRFMSAYALLARLPRPRRSDVDVAELVHRAALLETRLKIAIHGGPPVAIQADGDQLEQLLINIIRNAVDASVETGGGVTIGWERRAGWLEIYVDDQGPGISETSNLFVPFFTTKPEGSGIGLVLSRQIAEAHDGTLALVKRAEGPGTRAVLRLPLSIES
ncbi:MAG: ATP-binding protein [Gemmatimonadaceae bacterium]